VDLRRVLIIAVRLLLVTFTIMVVAWVIWVTRVALSPFLLGGLIFYVLFPIVNRIENIIPDHGILHHVRRTIAVLTVYIVGFIIFFVVLMTFGPVLYREIIDLGESIPDYWDTLQVEGEYWIDRYERDVPESIRDQIESNLDQIGSMIAEALRTTLLATIGTVSRFIGILLGLLILPLWVFYVLKDQRQGANVFYNMWPEPARADVRNIVGIIDYVMGRYIRGQLFLGLVVGLVSGIGFWLLGVPQPAALGVVAGLLEMVPILGPWITFFIAALVVIATDPSKLVAVAILCFLVQQLENTFLVPRVQGTAVSMHPAIIMVLLVIGGSMGGLIGIIAIVPLAAAGRDVFLYLHRRLSGRIILDAKTGLPMRVEPRVSPPAPRNPDQ
jgi:predicted PurR-regulated permease PerM